METNMLTKKDGQKNLGRMKSRRVVASICALESNLKVTVARRENAFNKLSKIEGAHVLLILN